MKEENRLERAVFNNYYSFFNYKVSVFRSCPDRLPV